MQVPGTAWAAWTECPVVVSLSGPGCDWLHLSLAQGPCSVVGRPLLPQASRNLHPPTNLASSQRPRRALWSNPFSITKHSHPLHPKAKRDASQNRPQPSTTIENYQANLFARDFAAPFVQPLAKSPPIWPASAIFSFRLPAFFPSALAAAHPTPPPSASATARTKHFRHSLLGRIASQSRPAPKDRPPATPRPAYAIRPPLSTRHGPFVHPSLDCTARQPGGPSSSRPHSPDTLSPAPVSTRPGLFLILSATLLGLSFTSPCLC